MGGDANQFIGNKADTFFDLCFPRLPGNATQAVGAGRVLPAVTGQHLNGFHRDVELIPAVISQPHEVVGRAFHFKGFKALKTAYPVFGVDHQIAFGKGRSLGDDGLGGPPFFPAP